MLPIIRILNVEIRVFPLVLLFAIFICTIIFLKNKRYNYLCLITVPKSILFILPFLLLGGKLLFIIVCHKRGLSISIYDLFSGGFVFYGGLIGGLIGLGLFSIVKNTSFIDISDIILSITPLGQSIGRIGCYLNGCCYGVEWSNIFSVKFLVEGVIVDVFPVWFIESFLCFLMFISLQRIIQLNRKGLCTGLYFVSYSLIRFVLEFFRGDTIRGVWNVFSTSQYISVVFFAFGIILFLISIVNKKTNKLLN